MSREPLRAEVERRGYRIDSRLIRAIAEAATELKRKQTTAKTDQKENER